MREIAAMPDQMALEEAALMRDLASMKEEPDEGDVLMAALLAEEEAERRAKEAIRRGRGHPRRRPPPRRYPTRPRSPRCATLAQEKHEAVRLKRAATSTEPRLPCAERKTSPRQR